MGEWPGAGAGEDRRAVGRAAPDLAVGRPRSIRLVPSAAHADELPDPVRQRPVRRLLQILLPEPARRVVIP